MSGRDDAGVALVAVAREALRGRLAYGLRARLRAAIERADASDAKPPALPAGLADAIDDALAALEDASSFFGTFEEADSKRRGDGVDAARVKLEAFATPTDGSVSPLVAAALLVIEEEVPVLCGCMGGHAVCKLKVEVEKLTGVRDE